MARYTNPNTMNHTSTNIDRWGHPETTGWAYRAWINGRAVMEFRYEMATSLDDRQRGEGTGDE